MGAGVRRVGPRRRRRQCGLARARRPVASSSAPMFRSADDWRARPCWRLPAHLRQQSTTVRHPPASTAITPCVYGGTHQGPLGIGLGASYTFQDISTSRTVVFPGFSDATSARYGGGTAQVFGEFELRPQSAKGCARALRRPGLRQYPYRWLHRIRRRGKPHSAHPTMPTRPIRRWARAPRCRCPSISISPPPQRSAGGMPSARFRPNDTGGLHFRRRSLRRAGHADRPQLGHGRGRH